MNKKSKRIIIGITLVFSSIVFIAASNNYTKPKNMKEKAQYSTFLKSTNDASKVVATVDGNPITKNDVDNAKLFRQDNLSDKEMIDRLIKNKLLKEEAPKLGVHVTLEEAKEEALRQKNIIESNSSEEDKQKISDIIAGLGITPKQYWNEYVPMEYQKIMTIEKVKKIIGDQAVSKNNKLKSSDMDLQKVRTDAIEYFENQLIEKADVKIFN